MAFSDEFTNAGAQQNLSARSGWSLVDGTASDVFLPAAGSTLHCIATTDTSLLCTDQGSANHYTEVVWSGNCSGFITIRHTDSNNFIGFRNTGSFWQVFKRVAGTFTELGAAYAAASSPGDVAKLSGNGNTLIFTVNGTQRVLGAGLTETDHNSVTRQGVMSRSDAGTPWINNWVADVFSAAPTITGPTGKQMTGGFFDLSGGTS